MSSSTSDDSSSSARSTSESTTDSDDNFIENVIAVIPRPRTFRNRNNLFEMYNDMEFKYRYRLDKETVVRISNIIGNNLESMTLRNKAVSVMDKILVTLRFYATGSFQQVLADHINISQPTVSRIIAIVSRSLASLRPEFIRMPTTEEERRRIKLQFYSIRQFPCVLGAIDCTHIRIQSPGGFNAELYRNRKGWFSYNVQCVCDANLKFLDIIARWPGSVHDSTIFNDSHLKVDFEENRYPGSLLLGDAGYALKSYLYTPLLNPQTEKEIKYNNSHIQTRNTIERAFGVWKRRFPCLSVGMRIKKDTILHVIVATAVLHNLCILLNDDIPELNDINVDNDENDELIIQENVNGNFRNAFINDNFD